MTASILRISVGLAVWGGSMYAALAIAGWPGDWGHGICGPWGCGPPVQALLAYHLWWLVALVPPAAALVGSKGVSNRTVRQVGLLLVALAASGLLAVVAYQFLIWLPDASEWQQRYFWQRCGFSLAMAVDIPMAQVLLIGLCLWRVARLRGSFSRTADSAPGGEPA